MGDAVMERVAQVPELPEVETSWVRSDALGNSRRQNPLGGPMGRSAAQALEDANHGAAAGLIPMFLPSSGMDVTVDELRGQIWIENRATEDLGWSVPGVEPGTTLAEGIADMLSGGSTGAGWSRSNSIAIGLPMSRARGLSGDGASSMRADEVAALLGLDDRVWLAAVAVTAGDLSRASELPQGAIVRSARSVGARGGLDSESSGLGTAAAAKFEVGGGYATETTVWRDRDTWIVDISLDQRVTGSIGIGVNLGLPGVNAGASQGGGLGQSQTVTLHASTKDADATAKLAAVLAYAKAADPDPIAAVPGAEALLVERSRTGALSASGRMGILMNSLTFDGTWDRASTLYEGSLGDSATGTSRATHSANLGFDNALTRTLFSGDVGPRGGTRGEFEYGAVGDATSIVIGGGTTGTTYDVRANQTQVRLNASDADAIMQAARSEQEWLHLYIDLEVQTDWLSLRTDLLQASPVAALYDRDPDLALQVARLKLIASYVTTSPNAVEPLLNALGRGKLPRAGKAVGVLEVWPEGSETVHSLYDHLGSWMELVPRDEWGDHDPVALLLQLGQLADRLYGQIESFTHVPERARLEMLGQVLAWQDTLDDAWCRIGAPNGACGAATSHRPSSLARLEHLAGECRSEASPHLFVLEPLLCRPSEISVQQEASFDALPGILAYWKVVATELRSAYERLEIPQSSWLVRPNRSEPERELDPQIHTWLAMREAALHTRHGVDTESTYALL